MTEPPELKVLRFDLGRIRQEMDVLPGLAAGFLDGGDHRLRQAAEQVKVAGLHPDRPVTWQVPQEEPIRTIPSRGEYEKRNDGRRTKGVGVVGELSFRWDMHTSAKKPVRHLSLTGNASTKIRLLDVESDEELAMWRMEVGDDRAPGCCFHVQVRGEEVHPPFPGSVPVPRLPTYPPTPMACLEFLLGELFQVRWRREALREGRLTRGWRKIQMERMLAFLAWQHGVVKGTSRGTPLLSLKAFPDPAVLLL